jgi:S1-C subfamily serine protease
MNLNLNTQQIVLLCLLVAFVTSIATGITVVSLTDQSQRPVTQTINRVVERTIEKVVEPDNNEENVDNSAPERIIETVVVNQEDLTVEAVQKNSRSLVRIHKGEEELGEFVTLGVVVSNNSIVVDKNLILKNGDYIAKTQIGNIAVDVLSYDESENFLILQLSDGKTGLEPAQWGDSNSLQLAQSVISISGSQDNSISTGVINKLDSFEKTEGGNTWKEVSSIYTGVDADNVLTGSVITNLQGKIVGFKTYNPNIAKTIFTPANIVKQFLSARGI